MDKKEIKIILLKTAIIKYLSTLGKIKRISHNSIDSYRRDLNWLTIRISDHYEKDKATGPLTQSDFRTYVVELKRKGLSSKTIARRLSCWRGFFDWVCENNINLGYYLGFNPLLNIKSPKSPKLLPKSLSVDDTVNFLNFVSEDNSSWIAIRDIAIFELTYSTGIRVSELVNLNTTMNAFDKGWIDLESGFIEVFGKRSKRRRIPVGKPAKNAVEVWLNVRTALISEKKISKSELALFTNKNGTRLSARSIQRRFELYSKKSTTGFSVNPHTLRHSFASHILQSSGDLRAVQELLGHSKISTTQIYTSLDHQHLAKVYDLSHPRAHLEFKK